MNKAIVRGLAAVSVLVLAVSAQPVWLQKRGGGGEPPQTPKSCTCFANGLHCFFGTAQGCGITCYPPLRCHCEGARCIFGFPIASECDCE